jgi:L-histidine N-alpha-methyltransferase
LRPLNQPVGQPDPAVLSHAADGTDLYEGLSRRPLAIPSKYFYDDRGSALFDAICELPEYYPTRTEQALLDSVSAQIAQRTGARHLAELGAGTARKTRVLIRALLREVEALRYSPLDISRYALEQAAAALSGEFPQLEITGIRCDYTAELAALEAGPGCLAVFLGSSIGNFTHLAGVALLRRLRNRLKGGDWFLMGVDLVKSPRILEAAYNDSAGVTAAFNRNILRVVNREVGADFDPTDFRHLAFYDREAQQIEMHLVARRDVRVRLQGDSTARLLVDAGFHLEQWFVPENGYVALALARVVAEGGTAPTAERR